MTRPKRTFHDVSTGEVVVRELNDEEFSQYEADQEVVATQIAAEAAAAEAKASAEAKLAALGLTAEEIAALTK